jgi:energy-coupling factor transporter ATP-binding protein EcfA2
VASGVATLSRSQDRAGWTVIFRHPALLDIRTNKPGRRVRYGLGTRDEEHAARLVAQINELLADNRWHTPSARAAAVGRFDPRVVDIFFDKLDAADRDPEELREHAVPLPSTSRYRRVLLLGTTGAGKTTLLRQLIGTDPVEERFPTTATGRTTVADMEIITDDGPYTAMVTFFPLDEVRDHLVDCVLRAVVSATRGEHRDEIQRALLQHPDQRFRFNYVLGDGEPRHVPNGFDDLLGDPTEPSRGGPVRVMPELGEIDLAATTARISATVDRVIAIAQTQGKALAELSAAAVDHDQRLVAEQFEEQLEQALAHDELVHALVDDLIEEMKARFDLIGEGSVARNRQSWPETWTWSSDDRAAFIRQLRRFTSNAKAGFGRLLTPLVNGIRVRGPFTPAWHDGVQPRFVFFDTEGLGHTPDSSSSIPTRFTERIDHVDAVVLVDNAQQPMQAAPAAVLRSLARTGHAAKLFLCFTHFDLITGDNLPTERDKAMHIHKSCDTVLTAIGKNLGHFAERPLRTRVDEASYYLADAHRVHHPTEMTVPIRNLRKLLTDLARSGNRPTLAETRPVYDEMNLLVAIRDATADFQRLWRAILGLGTAPGVDKEHWARVKALSRRFANRTADEYLHLRPVAQLQGKLQEQIWLLIQSPVKWSNGHPIEEDQQAFYDEYANRVSRRLLATARRRIAEERHRDWQDAFGEAGPGSTLRRARIIADDVYAHAAPIPQAVPTSDGNAFIREVINAFRETAAELKVGLV